jgi:hypothetical protein
MLALSHTGSDPGSQVMIGGMQHGHGGEQRVKPSNHDHAIWRSWLFFSRADMLSSPVLFGEDLLELLVVMVDYR